MRDIPLRKEYNVDQKDSKQDQDLATVDNVEVASLTDDDLDTVAGGAETGPIIVNSNAANACCIGGGN